MKNLSIALPERLKILLNAYITLHNRKIKQYYFEIVLTLISASVMGHFCLHLSKSLWNELTKAIFTLNCRNGESQNTLKFQCYLWFPGGSDSKASVYNAGDPGLNPGLGRSPGEGNGYPL